MDNTLKTKTEQEEIYKDDDVNGDDNDVIRKQRMKSRKK